MNTEISKTIPSEAFFQARLDEIRMSGHERLKAKAQLARAEAIAEVLASLARGVSRLARSLAARPVGGRPASSH